MDSTPGDSSSSPRACGPFIYIYAFIRCFYCMKTYIFFNLYIPWESDPGMLVPCSTVQATGMFPDPCLSLTVLSNKDKKKVFNHVVATLKCYTYT